MSTNNIFFVEKLEKCKYFWIEKSALTRVMMYIVLALEKALIFST